MFDFDGCTNFPDFAAIKFCCWMHDGLYVHQPDGIGRDAADMLMSACTTALANPLISLAMAFGVVPFGWLFWNRGRRAVIADMPRALADIVRQYRDRKTINWKAMEDEARKDDPRL